MSDAENLVLEPLRKIRQVQDEHGTFLKDLRGRIQNLEQQVAGVRRDLLNDAERVVTLQTSVDRMQDDLDLIKRRLELEFAPQP